MGLAALGTSAIATGATTVYQSLDYAVRLANVQGAKARMESLVLFLDATPLAKATAAEQFAKILEDLSFIPDELTR